jgi:hypothetical protein
MQINEVTQLNEASIGDMLTAIFVKDPTLQGLDISQRAAAIEKSRTIEKLAKTAYNNWLQKYVQLVRVNQNQPLASQNFKDEVRAYIQDILLPRAVDYNSLQVKNQLDQTIAQLDRVRNDPDQAAAAFERIVELATIARADPRVQARQQTAQQYRNQPPTAGAPAGSAAQSRRAVKQVLLQTLSRPQQSALTQLLQGSLASPNSTVRSTGVPLVDAFLNELGIKTQ